MLWLSQGFQGDFDWASIMPRDTSVSDCYTCDRCCFPNLEGQRNTLKDIFYREWPVIFYRERPVKTRYSYPRELTSVQRYFTADIELSISKWYWKGVNFPFRTFFYISMNLSSCVPSRIPIDKFAIYQIAVNSLADIYHVVVPAHLSLADNYHVVVPAHLSLLTSETRHIAKISSPLPLIYFVKGRVSAKRGNEVPNYDFFLYYFRKFLS